MNMGAGAACARARLLQMIEDLVRSIDIQMRTQPSHRFGLKASQDEHRAIVAACRAKHAPRQSRCFRPISSTRKKRCARRCDPTAAHLPESQSPP